MNTLFVKNTHARDIVTVIGLVLLIIAGLVLFFPSAFADNTGMTSEQVDNATTMLGSVISVITTLCTVVGIILGIVGFVKFIIAHANEQGPDQQKAIMWIAVAIILVIVPNVLNAIKDSWIPLIATETT